MNENGECGKWENGENGVRSIFYKNLGNPKKEIFGFSSNMFLQLGQTTF